jgi:hypothetical protein
VSVQWLVCVGALADLWHWGFGVGFGGPSRCKNGTSSSPVGVVVPRSSSRFPFFLFSFDIVSGIDTSIDMSLTTSFPSLFSFSCLPQVPVISVHGP